MARHYLGEELMNAGRAELFGKMPARRKNRRRCSKTTSPGMRAPDATPGTPDEKPNLIARRRDRSSRSWAKLRPRCVALVFPAAARCRSRSDQDLCASGGRRVRTGDPPKNIAKRLQKEGLVERFNQKSGIFPPALSNNDATTWIVRAPVHHFDSARTLAAITRKSATPCFATSRRKCARAEFSGDREVLKIKRSQPAAAPTGKCVQCRSCRRLRSFAFYIKKQKRPRLSTGAFIQPD